MYLGELFAYLVIVEFILPYNLLVIVISNYMTYLLYVHTTFR